LNPEFDELSTTKTSSTMKTTVTTSSTTTSTTTSTSTTTTTTTIRTTTIGFERKNPSDGPSAIDLEKIFSGNENQILFTFVDGKTSLIYSVALEIVNDTLLLEEPTLIGKVCQISIR